MAEINPPDAATRNKILDRLKREGSLSALVLAEGLAITPMAVRLQLNGLEEQGLVSSSPVSAGRGRPTKFWSLTDDASRIFPDAHQALAVDLIEIIKRQFGPQGLKDIVDQHSSGQLENYKELMADTHSLEDRVRALADLRNNEGYMACATNDGDGWLLIENHCPVCAAAKACSGLCANELSVFAKVLGPNAHVERTEHILSGAHRCVYRITPIN